MDPDNIYLQEETPTEVRVGMQGRIMDIDGESLFIDFLNDPLWMWINSEQYPNVFIINNYSIPDELRNLA